MARAQRKRRRLRAYQGDEAEATASRSTRLKQWALASGKRERDRVLALEFSEQLSDPHVHDEITQKRAVRRVQESVDARGTLPVVTILCR